MNRPLPFRIALRLSLCVCLAIAPIRYLAADDSNSSSSAQSGTSSNGDSAGSEFIFNGDDQDPNRPDQQVNDEKCPMVDERPYADLKGSVDKLASSLNIAKCQDPSDRALVDASQSILKNRDELTKEWSELDKVGDPSVADINIGSFTGNIEGMIESIKTIDQQLSQGPLNNKSCLNQMNSLGIMAALGDIASSLAPYAILGASMNPQWKAGVKGIVGLVGLGSAAKIFKNSTNKSNIMDNANDREKLLQNVCEFIKVDRRLKQLDINRASEFGKTAFDQIKEDLDRKDRYQQIIFSKLMSATGNKSNDMASYLNARKALLTNLLTIEKQLKKDRDAFRELTKEYGTLSKFTKDSSDSHATSDKGHHVSGMTAEERQGHSVGLCVVLNRIFSSSTNSNPPFSAIPNLKALINLMNQAKVDRSMYVQTDTLIDNDGGLRFKFKEQNADCEKYAFPYLENLKAILTLTRTMAADTRLQLKNGNNLSPQMEAHKNALMKFQQDEERIEKERQELKRLSGILENLRTDNASIDISEMTTQITEVYRALFSQGGGFIERIRKSSPAMAWLNQIHNFHIKAAEDYRSAAQKEILNHAKNFPMELNIPKKTNAAAFPMLSSATWQNLKFWFTGDQKRIDDNLEFAKKLQGYTIKNLPLNSPYRVDVCKNLINLQRKWIYTWDHLNAQKYFCRQIEGLLTNSDADPQLLNYCIGIKRPANRGSDQTKTNYEKIPDLHQYIQEWDKETKDFAQILSERITTLQCKTRPGNWKGNSTSGGTSGGLSTDGKDNRVGEGVPVERPTEKR